MRANLWLKCTMNYNSLHTIKHGELLYDSFALQMVSRMWN